MTFLMPRKRKQCLGLAQNARSATFLGLAVAMVLYLYRPRTSEWFVAPRGFHAADSSPPSSSWDATLALQREKQRDYCVRQYTGHAPREDIFKVVFQQPSTNEGYDFFVYKEGDIVSQDIITSGSYEPQLLLELGVAMQKAALYYGKGKQELYFLDIGGNIGTHTMYMRSLGYSGIVFEPMPANEDLIRSTLCANDPNHRITLFTKGLSDETKICDVYSPPRNKGATIHDN